MATFKVTLAGGKVVQRSSENKTYTHVSVFNTASGVQSVMAWHTSEALALKEARRLENCRGRANFGEGIFSILPVDAEQPSNIKNVQRALGKLLMPA